MPGRHKQRGGSHPQWVTAAAAPQEAGTAAVRGTSRLPAGTGNGYPSTARRPADLVLRLAVAGAVGGRVRDLGRVLTGHEAQPSAAGDVPDRHRATVPHAGGHRGRRVARRLGHAGRHLRAVPRHEAGDTSLAMLTRVLTCTQNWPGGPVTTLVQPEPRNWPTARGSSGCRSRTGGPGVAEVASVCVTRVVLPSERWGSIWKMPPWAQSLAWTFIDRPVPVRGDHEVLVVELERDGAAEHEAAVVGDLAGEHRGEPATGHVHRVGGPGERWFEHREVRAARRTGVAAEGRRTCPEVRGGDGGPHPVVAGLGDGGSGGEVDQAEAATLAPLRRRGLCRCCRGEPGPAGPRRPPVVTNCALRGIS